MIKYKQLPAQSFQSPPEKYDMKCLGISLFLGGDISFLTLRFFHSSWDYFIPCPSLFSFPLVGISFLALRFFHSSWGVFHSLPFAFFIPLGGYFIPCPSLFSFPLGGISILALRFFHSLLVFEGPVSRLEKDRDRTGP